MDDYIFQVIDKLEQLKQKVSNLNGDNTEILALLETVRDILKLKLEETR